jgi:hypothetical protein
MNEHLPPIRRVVTGDDAKGNSRIVEDAPATSVRNVAARPGYRAVNVWADRADTGENNRPRFDDHA